MARSLLLSCEAVSKAYGTRSLFDGLTLGLFEGDQAGLVGPNGSGKSTLLKILAGDATPDRGSRSLRNGVRVGYVPQDPVFPSGRTVDDVVMASLAGVDEEDRPGRRAHALSRAGFADGRASVDTLSGGWKKRLAIARELATAPEVVWFDGLYCPVIAYPARAIVDGDRLIAAIAAASILAKTERDAMLAVLDRSYPAYGFARHKGYATPEHVAALRAHGPCPVHRRHFAHVDQLEFDF